MKLSLSWIFDHIVGTSWKDHNVEQLIERFNVTTAEIESYTKIEVDLALFTLARLIEKKESEYVLYCDEHAKELRLPVRDGIHVGQIFLLKKQKDGWRWATLNDWFSSKDGLVPALSVKDNQVAGEWKNSFSTEDYVLEISNTSITHRPDMWSHRGVAREIAALLDLSLVSQEKFLADIAVRHYEHFASATEKNPFTVSIEAPAVCKRLAVLHVPSVRYADSALPITFRLALVDAKPINAIVDATNYVMFDLGQPMHAFDANKLGSHQLTPRMAHEGETLKLLDDQMIELASHDLVITNGTTPIALAGVMGGDSTKISSATTQLLLEAACFDAATIRNAALRHKRRTESSTRFEKSIDPLLNVPALQRFVALLLDQEVVFEISEEIVSLGLPVEERTIVVSHTMLESALGVLLEQDFIINVLSKLGMTAIAEGKGRVCEYVIRIPSYRSKDIQLPEDIVEEIGRFYGYVGIPQILPKIEAKPFDNRVLEQIRAIKRALAFGVTMHEVNNYPLYDEEFLQKLSYEPEHAVGLKNPVSDTSWRLVTSLVPHLLKNVVTNKTHIQDLRFFELARVWQQHNNKIDEQKVLAALIADPKMDLDFYRMKYEFSRIFELLHANIMWKRSKHVPVWFHPYKSAQLEYEGIVIGYAGMLHPRFCKAVDIQNGFVFELYSELFLHKRNSHADITFEQLAKYQDSWFDISMLLPASITVEQLQITIAAQDNRIFNTELVDFFQKEEWLDKRSVTIRTFVRDAAKTLTKPEIDAVYEEVVHAVKKYGAEIR